MTCYGVIADDLTGAMDAGVQMLEQNYVVRVAFDIHKLPEWESQSDVIIMSTESRNVPMEKAYSRVLAALEGFRQQDCRLIYKKIDSTLRGNIGAELLAVLESGQTDCVVIAPALPFNGRTTVNGVHYVYGSPLENTELAKDPYAPVYESEISMIIQEQYPAQVGMIDIRTIRNGAESVSAGIEECVARGTRLLVADAIDDGDLRSIVQGSALYRGRLLLCGSAGLFKHIEQLGSIRAMGMHTKLHLPRRKRSAPVLVLSGSPARMSKLQIQKFEESCDRSYVLRVNVAQLAGGEAEYRAACADAARITAAKLKEGCHVVVDASGDSKENILNYYQDNWQELQAVRKKVLGFLGEMALAAADAVGLRGLVLFGGDTAVAVTRKLGAGGIEITREIEPYIPLGVLIGGEHTNVPVVTKSGGFGREDSLVSIVKKLEQ